MGPGLFVASASGLPQQDWLEEAVSRFPGYAWKTRIIGAIPLLCTVIADKVFDYAPASSLTFRVVGVAIFIGALDIAKKLNASHAFMMEQIQTVKANPKSDNLVGPLLKSILNPRGMTDSIVMLYKGGLQDLIKETHDIAQQQGSNVGAFILPIVGPIVISTDQEQNAHVLKHHRFSDHTNGGQLANLIADVGPGRENLILANKAQHDRFKKTLVLLFNGDAIKRYYPTIRKITEQFFAGLGNGPVHLIDKTREHTSLVLTNCLFGTEVKEPENIARAVSHLMALVWKLVQGAPKENIYNIMRKFKIIHVLFGDRIDFNGYRRCQAVFHEAIEAAKHTEGTLISYLQHAEFTPQEIIDNTITFFFGGTETTASLQSTLLGNLSVNPEEQGLIAEELRLANVFNLEELDLETLLNKLPRLRANLLESLRLVPPAPAVPREVLQPFTYNFVANLKLYFRDSEVVGEMPDDYRPQRFFENPDLDKIVMKGFGFGPNVCIGMKLALNEVLLLGAGAVLKGPFELVEGNLSDVSLEAVMHISQHVAIRFT
jgi:cytochrome P450